MLPRFSAGCNFSSFFVVFFVVFLSSLFVVFASLHLAFFKKNHFKKNYFSLYFWQQSPFSNLCAASHRPTSKMEVGFRFFVCFFVSVYCFLFALILFFVCSHLIFCFYLFVFINFCIHQFCFHLVLSLLFKPNSLYRSVFLFELLLFIVLYCLIIVDNYW